MEGGGSGLCPQLPLSILQEEEGLLVALVPFTTFCDFLILGQATMRQKPSTLVPSNFSALSKLV